VDPARASRAQHPRYPLETWWKWRHAWTSSIRSGIERTRRHGAPRDDEALVRRGPLPYRDLVRNNCNLKFIAVRPRRRNRARRRDKAPWSPGIEAVLPVRQAPRRLKGHLTRRWSIMRSPLLPLCLHWP